MSGRGSLRDALTITDQAIAYCDGALTDQEVSDMLGTLPSDNIFNLISCIGEGDAVSLLEALKKIGTPLKSLLKRTGTLKKDRNSF